MSKQYIQRIHTYTCTRVEVGVRRRCQTFLNILQAVFRALNMYISCVRRGKKRVCVNTYVPCRRERQSVPMGSHQNHLPATDSTSGRRGRAGGGGGGYGRERSREDTKERGEKERKRIATEDVSRKEGAATEDEEMRNRRRERSTRGGREQH